MNIKEIAVLAGVSNMTVSRVINNSGYVGTDTRNKIEIIIKENNYTPNAMARNLSKKQSNTIGVIISDIENHFFGSIIKGISNINDKENLNTILYNTDENLEKEEKAIDLMIEQRVKGCIISIVSSTKSKTNILKLKRHNIPFILLDREIYNANYNGIFLDDLYGGYMATKSLIENKHKNIAIITGDFDLKNAHDRYLGYLEALKEHSFPINNNYVYKGNFKMSSGMDFIDNILLNNPEITAVFSSNNTMTLGVLKRLREKRFSNTYLL